MTSKYVRFVFVSHMNINLGWTRVTT